MPYFAVGAIAISAFSGASAAKKANRAKAQDYINKLKLNEATNKAIGEANLQNTIRTGYRAGILNVQRGQSQQQAVKAGWDVSVKGAQALGQSQANAAASGTTGASVEAVADDIRRKVDEAQGNVDSAWETTQLNFDNQLNDLIQQGIDTLQTAQAPDTTGPAFESAGKAALLAGIGSATSFAVQYGTANMNLGLGTTSRGVVSGAGLQANNSSISGFRSPSIPVAGGGFKYSIN